MNMCIDAKQLRAALKEIEAAEANGFMHCLAVFRMSSGGQMLRDCRMEYSDLYERASDTNAGLDWGRNQRVSARYRFDGRKLVSLENADAK